MCSMQQQIKRCESSEESLDDYLDYVNQVKTSNNNLQRNNVHNLQDIRNLAPSGPRRPGEGVEDEDQGIVFVEKNEQGVVYIYITLLAAGFVIGPKGRSIHQICHISGADIRSWSTNFAIGSKKPRALRAFQIQGRSEPILDAIKIMVCAVDRYKELSEGSYAGLIVDKEQVILDITFHYQPPPKHIVPNAARIKSEGFIDKPPAPATLCAIDSGRIPLQDCNGLNVQSAVCGDKDNIGGPQLVSYNSGGYCVPSSYVVVPRGAVGYVQPPNTATYYPSYQYVQCVPPYKEGSSTISVPSTARTVTHSQVTAPYNNPIPAHQGTPIPQSNAGQVNMQQYPVQPVWSYVPNAAYVPSSFQMATVQPPPPPPTAPRIWVPPSPFSPPPYNPMYKQNSQLVKQTSLSPTGVQDEFRQA